MRNNIKPVEKVELKENKIKVRIIIAAIVFIIGISALIYGLVSL